MGNYQDEKNLMQGVAEPIAGYGIPVAVSDIWCAIQNLSPSNRQWIKERLFEQDDNESIDLISNEELATCYSIDEVGQRLRTMVHEHFSNRA